LKKADDNSELKSKDSKVILEDKKTKSEDSSGKDSSKTLNNNDLDSYEYKQAEIFKYFKQKVAYNYNLSLDSIGSEKVNSNSSDNNSDSKISKSGSNVDVLNLSDKNFYRIKIDNDFKHKWKRGEVIGKGAFGTVYQIMLNTGSIAAVKQVEMEEEDPERAQKEYDNVREEVNILKDLEHISIVKFLGTSLTDNIVNIFMDYVSGGTIESLLRKYGIFDVDVIRNYTSQIAEGVRFIHSHNVIHRDLKGKNIMVTNDGIIKLIDFGCAKRLKKNQSTNSTTKTLFKSFKGTPYWMAPEVIKETGHGSKADIWSIGCTIHEMATGKPPWSDKAPYAAIYSIGNGDSPIPELPKDLGEGLKDFFKWCLTRDPDERPSATDLLNHTFLK